MSIRLSYVGDPLSALGYALVGARRLSPERNPGAVAQALREAREDCDLVLLEKGYAELVEKFIQALVISDPLPPIVVVPCLHEDQPLSDLSVREARTVLGIGS